MVEVREHAERLDRWTERDASAVSAEVGELLVDVELAAVLLQEVATLAPRSEGEFEAAVRAECAAVANMLVEKNRAYGNSALDPVRVFSKASAEEQLLVRIDDKLSRLARGSDAGEDVVLDLLGYLILLRVARQKAKSNER